MIYKFLPSCSEFFNFEFLRVLGTAPFQGAEVGDCLEAAGQIKHNDPESWYTAWSTLASQAESVGHEALKRGDEVTARWAFLRASNYRRSSEFLLRQSSTDPRLLSAISQSVDNFKSACILLDSPVHLLDIPFEKGLSLPGYLFLPTQSTKAVATGEKTPVIINTGGFDSTKEELYYFIGSGARTRSYACLSFDGPGQGIVLRRDHVYLRGDWEVVISAVLDKLFSLADEHPEWNLDLNRIALVGASMGGYFALRGATDSRIKACISIDGFYDLGDAVRDRVPQVVISAIEQRWLSDRILDTLLGLVASLDFQTKWEFGHNTLVTGISSKAAVLREMLSNYTLKLDNGETLVSQIQCPVLVTGSKEMCYFPLDTGARRLYHELSQGGRSPYTELWIPESQSQGSIQAKVAGLGSLHSKVFSWLDSVFGVERGAINKASSSL
jgi:pimeloyl-ACP methyl ester carboxylesterase